MAENAKPRGMLGTSPLRRGSLMRKAQQRTRNDMRPPVPGLEMRKKSWNPIRQRGGTFDLFANMKGGPKAAPPRQLSRKALHAVQGSSPTGGGGGGGDGPSPSEDEQGISDSGEAAERPRPPMLKRSDRSGPPPLLRSGGATLSLAAIAVAEAKTVGDSLIEVSMSASIISNESTDIDADAKGPSPSASAADVGTGSAAAPFTMCEEPSVLANAKKGLVLGPAPSPAPSATESFARFADESNMMMDRTAAINLLDAKHLAHKDSSVLAPPSQAGSSDPHQAGLPTSGARASGSGTVAVNPDTGKAASSRSPLASSTTTTSTAAPPSSTPPSSSSLPSSSVLSSSSRLVQSAASAAAMPTATATATSLLTTRDSTAPVVNELSLGPQARSTPEIPEGDGDSSPLAGSAGVSSASRLSGERARKSTSSSSLSQTSVSVHGSSSHLAGYGTLNRNEKTPMPAAGSSVSFHGIGASTPETTSSRAGNISVDDLLELSSRLNDSSASRHSTQLNDSQHSRLDASAVSLHAIDESGVLDDTQLQHQMRRVQQRLGDVATKQLEDQNTSGFLEVEVLDTLLENLGMDDAEMRLVHAKSFMHTQNCDEEARITKKRFFESVRAGDFEKWLAEAHEKKNASAAAAPEDGGRVGVAPSPVELSYSYNGGRASSTQFASPVISTSRLSNIEDYGGSDVSLNQLSSPPSLSLSSMLTENVATLPAMSQCQEATLQKLFKDAAEDSRAPAKNISAVLTEWVSSQKDAVSSQQVIDVADQLSRSVFQVSMPAMPWPQFARTFKSFVAQDGNLSADLADSFSARQAAALSNDREESFIVQQDLRNQVLQERALRKQVQVDVEAMNQSQIVQTRGEIDLLNDSLSVMESRYTEADERAKQERRKAAAKDKEAKDREEENCKLLAEIADLRTKAGRSSKLHAEVESLNRQLQEAQRHNHGISFTSSELADVSLQDKKFDSLRHQMELTVQQKDQLLAEMEDASSTLHAMQQTLQEKDDLNNQLQLELGDIGDELGHLKRENQQLETSLLVTNIARRDRTISEANSNETLDFSIAEKVSRSSRSSSGGSIEAAVFKMSAQQEEETKALREKNGLLESELEHLRVELQQSNARVSSLEEEDAENKTTIERCNEIIKWLYSDLDRCKEQQDDESSEVEYLTGRIAELEDDLSRNHVKLDSVSAALTQAHVSATVVAQETAKKTDGAKKLVPALQAENLHLRKELGRMLKESSAMKEVEATEVQVSQQATEKAEHEAAEMKKQYSSLKSEASAIKDQNTQLHSEVVRLTTEARKSAALREAEGGAFVAHAAKLQAQILQLRSPHDGGSSNRSTHPSSSSSSSSSAVGTVGVEKLKEMERQVEMLQKTVTSLTSQRDSLKGTLSAAKQDHKKAQEETMHPHMQALQQQQEEDGASLRAEAGAGARSSEDCVAIRSLVETNKKLTANISYLLKRTKKLEKEVVRAKSSREVHTEKIHTVVREPAKIYMLRKSRTGAGQHAQQRGLLDVTNSADFSLVQARPATQEGGDGKVQRDMRRDGLYVPM